MEPTSYRTAEIKALCAECQNIACRICRRCGLPSCNKHQPAEAGWCPSCQATVEAAYKKVTKWWGCATKSGAVVLWAGALVPVAAFAIWVAWPCETVFHGTCTAGAIDALQYHGWWIAGAWWAAVVLASRALDHRLFRSGKGAARVAASLPLQLSEVDGATVGSEHCLSAIIEATSELSTPTCGPGATDGCPFG